MFYDRMREAQSEIKATVSVNTSDSLTQKNQDDKDGGGGSGGGTKDLEASKKKRKFFKETTGQMA